MKIHSKLFVIEPLLTEEMFSSEVISPSPRFEPKSCGDRAFHGAGTRILNSLPLNIKSAQTLENVSTEGACLAFTNVYLDIKIFCCSL